MYHVSWVGCGSVIACTTASSASAFASPSSAAPRRRRSPRRRSASARTAPRVRLVPHPLGAAATTSGRAAGSPVASSRNGLRSRRQYRIARSMACHAATGSLPSTVSARMPYGIGPVGDPRGPRADVACGGRDAPAVVGHDASAPAARCPAGCSRSGSVSKSPSAVPASPPTTTEPLAAVPLLHQGGAGGHRRTGPRSRSSPARRSTPGSRSGRRSSGPRECGSVRVIASWRTWSIIGMPIASRTPALR